MAREIGKTYLDEARRVVCVVDLQSEHNDKHTALMLLVQRGSIPFGTLTPEHLLAMEFPQADNDSIYHIFATTKTKLHKVVAGVVCVCEEREHAYREAALGMMDNILYR